MKKFTKIAASLTALVLAFGIVGCNAEKSGDYPDFIHSSEGADVGESSEKYTVNIRSAGGMKLNGVRVTAYNSNNSRIRSGISSDGVINFSLDLGEYTLVVDEDTLPDGYYLEEGVTYKTNPEKREAVDITIKSTVITQAAAADKVYSVGDIANDFVLEDYRTYDGTYGDENYTGVKNYKLSDLLKTKKAVVLNFWYTTCTYCTQEFPYLQGAYEDYKNDVEVLGICLSSYTKKQVATYLESQTFTLTFPIGIDGSGLTSKYSVTACPTTVVIDRYGMIAYWHEGGQPSLSFWLSLFKEYASDNYVQNIDSSDDNGEENGGSSTETGREIPDVTMPSSADMAAAASATGLNAVYEADGDDEYAWPWTVGTDEVYGSVITVTNSGKQNSYATLHVEITLKKDDLLSFDYMVSSELNCDKLYVLMDGQLINGDGWSGETGWTSEDIYVADRDKKVVLTFIYQKDETDQSADSVGDDTVKIKNIRTSAVSEDTEALDVIRQAASGSVTAGKYEHYVTPVLGSDGFYHVGSPDGPLLYISISNITPWSALHTENNLFETEYGAMYASLYMMTYYKYSETIEDSGSDAVLSFTVKIGDKDFADPVVAYQHILSALEEPYQLMPVSAQLKDWAESFTEEYEKEIGGSSHENEWLEFCFYYDHYGKEHPEDEVCMMDTDITQGITVYNSFEIGFYSTPAVGESVGKTTAKIIYPLSRPNAVSYKFTAPADGVYQIRDYGGSANPELEIMTMRGDGMTTDSNAFVTDVADFDQYTGVSYDNFNCYIVLSKGQTVYLNFRIEEQTTGDFVFDIIYFDTVDKLMNSSTANGAWTYDDNGNFIYLGVDTVYDSATDRYYLDDGTGNPDRECPVYINMIYQSYFISSLPVNYSSLETLIQDNLFKNVSANAQATMAEYLKQSKENTGMYYGLVEADSTIVEIINSFVGINVDGGAGDNRGWLAFACHMEHYIHDAARVENGAALTVGWNEITSAQNGTATVTFTAPDAGYYDFGVPEGSSVKVDGNSVPVTDGTATVLLLHGETVTVTVQKGASNVTVSVFKSVNMHETADGGDLYTGNNVIGSYSEGKATVTLTAATAGEYAIDLSDFASETVTVDGSTVALSDGVATVVLAKGQKATVTVTPDDVENRIIFTVTQTKTFNEVNDGKTVTTGENLIGTYNKDGEATVMLDVSSLEKKTTYLITITDCGDAPEITLNGEAVTTATDGKQVTCTVSVTDTDVLEITVTKGTGYAHTQISVANPK